MNTSPLHPAHAVIPNCWRVLIHCRQCKQSIIAALSLSYIQPEMIKLEPYQYQCQTHTKSHAASSTPTARTMYSTNAKEADLRIWRHAYQTRATRILVYSPDTDVYNIGLPLTSITNHQECIVQIMIFLISMKKVLSV